MKYKSSREVLVGDVVVLASGGPAMVVEEVGAGLIRVAWISGGVAHHDAFDVRCLTYVPPPPSYA